MIYYSIFTYSSHKYIHPRKSLWDTCLAIGEKLDRCQCFTILYYNIIIMHVQIGIGHRRMSIDSI